MPIYLSMLLSMHLSTLPHSHQSTSTRASHLLFLLLVATTREILIFSESMSHPGGGSVCVSAKQACAGGKLGAASRQTRKRWSLKAVVSFGTEYLVEKRATLASAYGVLLCLWDEFISVSGNAC